MFKNKYLAYILALAFSGAINAQTTDEIRNNKNADHVLSFGMSNDLKMWSPLKQINKSNVKRLVPVWSFSTANQNGELSQPTVYNGVMYVVNAEWTFAIDVVTGRQIWRTPVNYDRGALRVADYALPISLAGKAYTRVYLCYVREGAKAVLKSLPNMRGSAWAWVKATIKAVRG